MSKDSNCPVCGSTNIVELYSTDSQFVVKHLITLGTVKEQSQCIKKTEDLWGQNNATFYRCKVCSFEFANPFISADAEFYSLLYNSASNYVSEKWEYSITYGSIINYLKTKTLPPKLLEIGAGNGSFLKTLPKNVIPTHAIFATEYSEAGAKAIKLLGINCFTKNFSELTEQDLQGKVSIVCLFQVLEHLSDLHGFFEKLNLLTTSGSILYISVPNFFHRKFFDRYGYFYDLPPVHVGRFNYTSMAELSGRHGWEILHHAIQPTSYKNRVQKFLYTQFANLQSTFTTEDINPKLLRLFLRYGIYLLLIFMNIKVIVGLRRSHLGIAQWFELKKTN